MNRLQNCKVQSPAPEGTLSASRPLAFGVKGHPSLWYIISIYHIYEKVKETYSLLNLQCLVPSQVLSDIFPVQDYQNNPFQILFNAFVLN